MQPSAFEASLVLSDSTFAFFCLFVFFFFLQNTMTGKTAPADLSNLWLDTCKQLLILIFSLHWHSYNIWRITTRHGGFVHALFKEFNYVRCWLRKNILNNNEVRYCLFMHSCIIILRISMRNICPVINILLVSRHCFNTAAGGVNVEQHYPQNKHIYCTSGTKSLLVTVSRCGTITKMWSE